MSKPAIARVICLASLAAGMTGCGPQEHVALEDAGLRPTAEVEPTFPRRLDGSTVMVFPTVVRHIDGSEYNAASAARIARFLREHESATPMMRDDRVLLDLAPDGGQWDVFQQGLHLVGEHLAAHPVATDYAMVVEVLVYDVRGGGQAVGGIQGYILDAHGRNAFSFLLNSHHELFADAPIRAPEASPEARQHLAHEATDVYLAALKRQLEAAR